MDVTEAFESIREKLFRHWLLGRKTLWATLLKQIATQDAFTITPARLFLIYGA